MTKDVVGGTKRALASGAPQKALLPRALPAVVHTFAFNKRKILTKTLDKRDLVYYLCTAINESVSKFSFKQTSILEVDVCFFLEYTSTSHYPYAVR
jgi:hypothetical protein